MSLQALLINVIGFQLGWFACVLSAANNQPVAGIMIAYMIVAIHLYLAKNKTQTIILLLSVTLLGSLWDSLLSSQNVLVFNTGIIATFLAPYWIITMWTLFATTLNVSFRWLYGHYWYAMIIGAISGPLTYLAGAALGAVVIPQPLTAIIILAIGWSVILPVTIKMAELLDCKSELKVVYK